MILELDCGNSLIKWRLVDKPMGIITPVTAVDSVDELLLQLMHAPTPKRGRLVSVRTEQETQAIVQELSQALQIPVAIARPASFLAGVTNGYDEPERLGMDRWLAVVGAYQLTQKACLVIDLGTAVTVDLVTASGKHLGGFITPGLPMLRGQLQQHTRRVRYSDAEAREALATMSPGSNTGQAVERGCLMMLRAYIERQIREADHHLGIGFSILATGGDAGLIADLSDVACIPDLVFEGLAIACP